MLGSYIAYMVNSRWASIRSDRCSVVLSPLFFVLGMRDLPRLLRLLREARRGIAAGARVLLRHPVHHRGGAGADLRRRLPHGRRALYRRRPATRPISTFRCAWWCRSSCRADDGVVVAALPDHRFFGRAVLAVSQDRLALRLMGVNPSRVKEIAFGISIAPRRRGRVPDHHPAGRAVDRARVHRPGVRGLRARRHEASAARCSPRSCSASRNRSRRRSSGRHGRRRSRSGCSWSRSRATFRACSADERDTRIGPSPHAVRRRSNCRRAAMSAPERSSSPASRARLSRNEYVYLRRLRGAAVRRPRDRVEHPRRLHGLRELRLRGVLRDGCLHDDLPLQGVPAPLLVRSWRRWPPGWSASASAI